MTNRVCQNHVCQDHVYQSIYAKNMSCCDLQAEKKMIEAEENKEYLPIDGLASFKKATLQLLLGSDHAAIKEVSLAPCTDS